MLSSASCLRRVKAYFLNSLAGTLLLGKVGKKLFRRHRKGSRQFYDILQGYIPFASFYTAHVVAVQSRSFGQFLLRIATFVTQPSQRGTESRLYGTNGHTSILEL
jgi:hypothetical protein